MKELKFKKRTLLKLLNFIEKYGETTLLTIIENYEISHNVYILKHKTCIKQIPISSINFIEISGHHILFHTTNGIFPKYGTLKNEYQNFKTMGFVKCNQSVLIPVSKIHEIKNKNVILTTGNEFSLSRNCASSVISAFMLSTKRI